MFHLSQHVCCFSNNLHILPNIANQKCQKENKLRCSLHLIIYCITLNGGQQEQAVNGKIITFMLTLLANSCLFTHSTVQRTQLKL